MALEQNPGGKPGYIDLSPFCGTHFEPGSRPATQQKEFLKRHSPKDNHVTRPYYGLDRPGSVQGVRAIIFRHTWSDL
jgi:hypothetical protein